MSAHVGYGATHLATPCAFLVGAFPCNMMRGDACRLGSDSWSRLSVFARKHGAPNATNVSDAMIVCTVLAPLPVLRSPCKHRCLLCDVTHIRFLLSHCVVHLWWHAVHIMFCIVARTRLLHRGVQHVVARAKCHRAEYCNGSRIACWSRVHLAAAPARAGLHGGLRVPIARGPSLADPCCT